MADTPLIQPEYLLLADESQPASEMEALMRCAPGQEPVESLEEMNQRREVMGEALDEAMECLSELEKDIVLACVIERVPLRTLSRTLGKGYSKTWIAQIRDQALAKLRAALVNTSDDEWERLAS